MVLVLRDQTEAKNMQERMQRNDKLESLGILAGGLAHDFNNLLGGIFGYIELAHEMSSEEPVQSFLSKAMGVFDRAKAITMQLLTFSKGGPQCRRVSHRADHTGEHRVHPLRNRQDRHLSYR